MDKLTEKSVQKLEKPRKKGRFKGIKELFNGSVKHRQGSLLAADLGLFTLGFLFARAHLIFGARPVGLAFVALLPGGIWPALTGCVLGSLSMGLNGIIFAAAAVITVFLRAAISCADKDCDGKSALFCENLLLRMSASVIGGFVAALYRVLLDGFTRVGLLFGLCMILTPPLLVFAFSGIFSLKAEIRGIIHGGRDVLSLSGKDQREKYDIIFFQLSSLMLIFFISLSLKAVSLLGISLSYVFSGVAALLTAKRFGAIRAAAVGFVSSLAISATNSVAFALAGLGAGFAVGFGEGYALVAGGLALCAWGAYSAGVGGLLSVFPEYAVSTVIAAPIMKKITEIKPEIEKKELGGSSQDMVGTMALAYQNKFSGSLDSLELTLSALSGVIRKFSSPSAPSAEEYRDIVIDVARGTCSECSDSGLCSREGIRPCIENAEKIAKKLLRDEQITPRDVNTDTQFCRLASVCADRINRACAKARADSYALWNTEGASEEYKLISRLINGARLRDRAEISVDDSMTEALTRVLTECGLENGTIRVFGERRRHFILAAEDPDGSKITSGELQRKIEKAACIRLSKPEYFRSGKMVLMECGIRRVLRAKAAFASSPGDEKEVSGDTVSAFESRNDYFYSLISDGMGRGEEAKATSEFVKDFMQSALEIGSANDTLLYMLNHTVKSRKEECSATVDLFELDLLSGEGTFIKSGAASSFVKRESSIFRIRSQTAPIGLLSTIDSEKIRVEIKAGDHIIMMSDGVADSAEDAPWLLLLLGEEPPKRLEDYAAKILAEAKKHSKSSDDMTVAVIRIEEA